jgi:hypothetical protein
LWKLDQKRKKNYFFSIFNFSSIITYVSEGAEKWLKNNLDIDLNEIEEEKNNYDNYENNENDENKEFKEIDIKNQNKEKDKYENTKKLINDFPEKPIIKAKILKEMNLSTEMIDAIYFHKGVLINELRAADTNNSGMISSNEIMMAFIKANIHKDLTSQLIMDIINIYLPAKTDKIDFMKMISYFLKDLKILIDNKNISKINPYQFNGNLNSYNSLNSLSSNMSLKKKINKTSTDFFKSNASDVLPKLGNEFSYISNNDSN